MWAIMAVNADGKPDRANNSLEPWKYTRISDGPGQLGAML